MVGDNLIETTDYNPKGKKIYKVGDEAWLRFNPSDGTIL